MSRRTVLVAVVPVTTTRDQQPRNSYCRVYFVFAGQAVSACFLFVFASLGFLLYVGGFMFCSLNLILFLVNSVELIAEWIAQFFSCLKDMGSNPAEASHCVTTMG